MFQNINPDFACGINRLDRDSSSSPINHKRSPVKRNVKKDSSNTPCRNPHGDLPKERVSGGAYSTPGARHPFFSRLIEVNGTVYVDRYGNAEYVPGEPWWVVPIFVYSAITAIFVGAGLAAFT